MNIAKEAKETRAAMRAAFVLVRVEDISTETRLALLDALERAFETYIDRCESLLLDMADDLNMAPIVPLRLVKK